jgi:hypothetical protein
MDDEVAEIEVMKVIVDDEVFRDEMCEVVEIVDDDMVVDENIMVDEEKG